MSEQMGPLSFGKKEEAIFLGREIAQHSDYSEETALQIDKEVKRIVMECYQHAKSLISSNLSLLKNLADSLLEKEVLNGDEIDRIIFGDKAKDNMRA